MKILNWNIYFKWCELMRIDPLNIMSVKRFEAVLDREREMNEELNEHEEEKSSFIIRPINSNKKNPLTYENFSPQLLKIMIFLSEQKHVDYELIKIDGDNVLKMLDTRFYNKIKNESISN